ncbi:hypothetical protein FC70_GL000879 [Paucilactobacillus oligofermentans DSM 15707 = LMG 22743]|uniref:Uncharacterized protein n=1 Tax=Paucilactobacillus oligofermentans DSM 15707 = LMG 22743 TaxID=1423778 RepID=A0A0R1RPA8_9LACO|nr:hypothetical protein [Paucilactobacillus oligofermentans]KRL55283.1 hypothetical protein FC70_GL000879 [Paucilactobacillus oligofermentans DSM 15707 = LMG 22743]CUS25726.1 Uncharacterized protein LACOL_0418 [Paucilactobacillus oligofermentans DSM 15707 = LMG 22743]
MDDQFKSWIGFAIFIVATVLSFMVNGLLQNLLYVIAGVSVFLGMFFAAKWKIDDAIDLIKNIFGKR